MTQRLGGENYVFWGGREGYQTLLNTDLKKELDHMVRPLSLSYVMNNLVSVFLVCEEYSFDNSTCLLRSVFSLCV